ncbi:MAG: hypothetical protein PHQ40_14915 [Anaerolineaceae bacterium]|nr:hypothetical protein [Anaerolineaceae bacterium]
MSEPIALAGRIRAYLEDLEMVVDRSVLLSTKALQSGDDGYWDGVALNLHSFYGATERIFEDIARTIDGSVPSGPDWHLGLLVQMSTELMGRRPAVISLKLREGLDEYRGFRHVVRNVYAFNFRPSRLKELVDTLPGCFDYLQNDLRIFAQFLESLAPSSSIQSGQLPHD